MLSKHPFFKSLIQDAIRQVVKFITWVATFFVVLMVIGALANNAEEIETKLPAKFHYGDKTSRNQFLSIPISGVILGDKNELDPSSLFSGLNLTYGYEVKDELYQAAKDNEVKGVILEINSPGGTIYGAQAISDGVEYFKSKTHKPVVAYVAGMAASGGYWASLGADQIIADYGTTIGSIGVIAGPFNYYDGVKSIDGGLLSGGVVTEKGIETFYISAGKSKDLGNPFRKMTAEEMQNLQTMVNHEYQAFVKLVAQKRSLDENQVKEKIGALIYDPVMALDLKLIDQIGSRETAYEALAKKAKVSTDNFQIVRHKKSLGLMAQLMQSKFLRPQTQAQVCSLNQQILAFQGDILSLCQ